MSVLEPLSGTRLVVVAGPGGVGKTTTAAAIAVALARSGRRTRVITADPARRLADALGGEGEIAPRLVAAMIESGRAFGALLPRMVPDAAARARIERSPVYQRFARSLARSHAYATLEVLHDALLGASAREHDVVVLDTPPMRGVLDLLDAPVALGRFAGSTAVDLLARDGVGGWALRRVLGLVLGAELAAGLGEFVAAFAPYRAGFGTRAEGVLAEIGRASTVLVSSADPVRRADAAALATALGERGLRPALLVGSMVCARRSPAWSPDTLPADDVHRAAVTAAHAMGASARRQEADARRALEAMAATLGCPLVVTRSLARDPVGPGALARLMEEPS